MPDHEHFFESYDRADPIIVENGIDRDDKAKSFSDGGRGNIGVRVFWGGAIGSKYRKIV